jgi:hypothetical protein
MNLKAPSNYSHFLTQQRPKLNNLNAPNHRWSKKIVNLGSGFGD